MAEYRLDQGSGTVVSDTTPLPVVLRSSAGVESPLAVSRVTYTDSSITSATGASQQLLAANTSRRGLVIVNPLTSTTDWVIDPMGGTAASGTMPGITLRPGDSWSPVPVPTNKITGIGTAASKLVVLEG